MRALVTLALVAVLPMVAAAQLPRDLGGLIRKMPSLDRLMKTRPLASSFDDTVGPQPWLERRAVTRQPGDMKRLARTSNGSVILPPGLWEGTFESFCLRPATWAPGAGDGYLWAPLKGGRANAIGTILRASQAHPNISQSDIQMLLWAILSRTRVSEMSPKLQVAARALLPAREINAIDATGLEVLNAADRTRLFRGVTGPIKQVLEVESSLRYELSKANANYAAIERIAVLSGVPPPENRNAIKRGQWSRHPAGYYVRYYPNSFAEMRLQVLVPPRVRIVRDQLNRIVSIEDSRGGKTEATYNDAIAPRPHPRNARLKAYAFKSIRITRRGTGARPEVIEINNQGYAFHQSRPRQRRGIDELLAEGVRYAVTAITGTPVEARQDWERWGERAERAQELYDDAGYLRDRAEAATTTGDEDAIDALGDTGHYGDGVEAATTGDAGDRVGWITETLERATDALEHAISVIDGAPTTSTTDDAPVWDPGGGLGIPSGGGQMLGSSGRFR